jgi:type IV pilus assembly protein PilW
MVIGLLATIVVMQMFNDSEKRNRTAMGSADAQSNGVLTFYQLQSHLQRAGYGLNDAGLFTCKLKWKVASGNYISVPVEIAPVTINPVSTTGGVTTSVLPAGDANTDTVLIMYGNGNGEPQGNTVIAYTAPVYTMQMPTAFAVGNRVIAAPAGAPSAACTTDLIIDRVTLVGTTTVTTALGAAGVALFNLGAGPDGENAAITATNPTNGPSIWAYAVRGGNLTVCDFTVNDCSLDGSKGDSAVWVPVASNIVSLRAAYWKDTTAAADGIPDVDTNTVKAHDQVQPTTGCAWARVPSVSIALVSRSEEPEHHPENPDLEIVTVTPSDIGRTIGSRTITGTANAPTWAQNAAAPLVGATGTLGPDTSANEGWKRYRYKTFEATVPLRNVGWLTVAPTASKPTPALPTGC